MYGRAGVDLLRARMMTLKAAICTKSLAIGYEPLWAIGSGQIPTSQSTLLTLMPKVSVCASRMLCTSALSFFCARRAFRRARRSHYWFRHIQRPRRARTMTGAP
jgi:hypothetical protein